MDNENTNVMTATQRAIARSIHELLLALDGTRLAAVDCDPTTVDVAPTSAEAVTVVEGVASKRPVAKQGWLHQAPIATIHTNVGGRLADNSTDENWTINFR